jgi:exosome complex RNA-binding protein Csl4
MPRNKLEKNVFPGEKLAVIEEFNEGPGTYQEEGEIRSTEIGISKLDTDRRAL